MNYPEEYIKAYIKRYFSDELLNDKTITGDMERQQLRKWLLTWAKDCTGEPFLSKGMGSEPATALV